MRFFRNNTHFTLIGLLVLTCLGLSSGSVQAQGQQKAIIFTGIVVAGKTTERLPGATILIPKAGKGVLATNDGYFSIPVFPGDSIVFSYVGYKTQYHKIPRNYNAETYSAIIVMRADVQMLAEVRVYPYATEEEFKKAFLELRLPDQAERDAIARSTSQEYLTKMAAITPNSAQTNFRYTLDQQLFGRESAANRGFATTFPFLNPFAWDRFIKSVKNGDLKKKEYRKELNFTPRENMTRQDLIKD